MPSTLADKPRPATRPAPTRPAPPLRHPAEGVTNGAADEPAPASVAMLPAELLQPGEIIILLIKPSPWFIVLSPLRSLLAIGLLTLLLLVLHNASVPLGLAHREILLLGVALAVLRLFWQFLEWLSRVYVLTDQRVIRIMGVLRVSIFETPLAHIQHTTLLFSLRERLTGLGTIGFATSGTGGFEAFWVMLGKPMEVHQKVVHAINRYRR